MSRTSRFLSGVGLGLFAQVTMTLVGLVITPILIHRLGDHDYGLWLVATQILAYLALSDLGVVALLPRETAYVTGRAGGGPFHEELRELLERTLRLVLWQQMLLVVPAALAIWRFLPAAWAELRPPLAIVLVVFVVTFPLRIFPEVLTGLQEFARLTTLGLIAWAAGTATSLTLVLAGYGLLSVATGWAVTAIVANVMAAWWVFVRYRAAFPGRLPRLSGAVVRDAFSRGGWVSLSVVSHLFLASSDLLILGRLLGPIAIVPYAITGKLVGVLSNQPAAFMQAALPALAELRAAQDRERLRRVLVALMLGMLVMSGLVASVIAVVNGGFVSWWLEPSKYAGVSLTLLLVAAMVLRHWNFALNAAMVSFGRERRAALTGIADGVLSLTTMVVLVKLGVGVHAAPIAMITGGVLVSLPWNLAAIAHDTGTARFALVARMVPALWRIVLVVGAAAALGEYWRPSSFWSLALATIAAPATFGLVSFPLLLREPHAPYVRPRLQRLLRWRLIPRPVPVAPVAPVTPVTPVAPVADPASPAGVQRSLPVDP